jgi:signal transduction histidine kinase
MKDDLVNSLSISLKSVMALLSSTLEDESHAAIVADRSFSAIFANNAARANLAGGEIVGRNLASILCELDETIDWEEFSTNLRTCGTVAGEMSVAKHGAQPTGYRISCTGITDEASGQVSVYVFIAKMISSTPDAATKIVALDRMLTRGEMAGEIAHEINNYLTILLGNVELIPLFLDNNDTEKVAQKLPLMKTTLEKIAAFSESIVDYGRPHRSFEIIDLNHMISKTIDFLKPQNRFDEIEIAANLSPQIPPVKGDSGQLQQVIVNLLHNAGDELSVSERPEPVIQIETSGSMDGKSTIVSVSDNGGGIPEELRPKLFQERFTTKDSGEGYGLLACKRIIDRHGGEISFHRMEGGGTCFEVRLPSSQQSQPESSEANSVPHKSAIHQ